MANRGRGEGTIYKKDNRWIGQYYDHNGKRKSVSGIKRKEVQEKLNKALVELSEGRYIDTPDIELGAFVRDYMETYKKQEIARTTYSNYCEYLDFYLYKEPISHVPLKKITTDRLQRFYNAMTEAEKEEDRKSGRTVRQLHCIMNGAFKNAVRRRLIYDNPNEGVSLPKKARVEITPPSIDEVKKMLEYSREHDDPMYGLWRLLALTGCRRGEVLAIQKKDINYETGEIVLHYSLGYMQKGEIEDGTDRKHISVLKQDMKNKASRGSVYADRETLDELKKIEDKQADDRRQYPGVYHDKILFMGADNKITEVDNDLLFTKEDGDFISGRSVLDCFRKLLDSCGLGHYRVHDMRHFFATNILAQTGDIALTSSMCRHKQISTTANIYVHHYTDRKVSAMQALAKKIE